MIFVDSNVLIDVFAPDQNWREWSRKWLAELGAESADLFINQIVLAELAANFPDLSSLLRALDSFDVEVLPLTELASFTAGRAFRECRRAHRDRSAILADFLIAGHAVSLDAKLLTRDTAMYRRYFPDLTLITPDTHP